MLVDKEELKQHEQRELAGNWNDPEWTCPQCGFVNMGVRVRCRNFHCNWDTAIVSEGNMLVAADV